MDFKKLKLQHINMIGQYICTNTMEREIERFVSIRKSHVITLVIDRSSGEALIDKMEIEIEEPIELALLLKTISQKLIKQSIHTIVQQVSISDWESTIRLVTHFEYVDTNTEHQYVITKIKTACFPNAVMQALGFEPILTNNNNSSE